MEQLSKEYVAVPIERYEQLICTETKLNMIKELMETRDGEGRAVGGYAIAQILENER